MENPDGQKVLVLTNLGAARSIQLTQAGEISYGSPGRKLGRNARLDVVWLGNSSLG